MIFSKVIRGLEIFNTYFDNDSYCLGAEHDCLHVYGTDRHISVEDFLELKELGWRQESWSDDSEEYSVDEGWHAWV